MGPKLFESQIFSLFIVKFKKLGFSALLRVLDHQEVNRINKILLTCQINCNYCKARRGFNLVLNYSRGYSDNFK